ncbi:hypothetical protein XAC9322_1000003 [Xanthomonas citri pv. citri]|nr:hypothetical protein XAC9322_1000003 [Xanthomonas citri pv. citri]
MRPGGLSLLVPPQEADWTMMLDTYDRVDLTGPWAGFGFSGQTHVHARRKNATSRRHEVLVPDVQHRSGMGADDGRGTASSRPGPQGDQENPRARGSWKALCHKGSEIEMLELERSLPSRSAASWQRKAVVSAGWRGVPPIDRRWSVGRVGHEVHGAGEALSVGAVPLHPTGHLHAAWTMLSQWLDMANERCTPAAS